MELGGAERCFQSIDFRENLQFCHLFPPKTEISCNFSHHPILGFQHLRKMMSFIPPNFLAHFDMKGFDPSHICVLRDLALDLGIVLECLHRWWEAPGFGFLWPQAKYNKYNKYNEWNVFEICKTKLAMAIKFCVSPCLTMNSIGVMNIL